MSEQAAAAKTAVHIGRVVAIKSCRAIAQAIYGFARIFQPSLDDREAIPPRQQVSSTGLPRRSRSASFRFIERFDSLSSADATLAVVVVLIGSNDTGTITRKLGEIFAESRRGPAR